MRNAAVRRGWNFARSSARRDAGTSWRRAMARGGDILRGPRGDVDGGALRRDAESRARCRRGADRRRCRRGAGARRVDRRGARGGGGDGRISEPRRVLVRLFRARVGRLRVVTVPLLRVSQEDEDADVDLDFDFVPSLPGAAGRRALFVAHPSLPPFARKHARARARVRPRDDRRGDGRGRRVARGVGDRSRRASDPPCGRARRRGGSRARRRSRRGRRGVGGGGGAIREGMRGQRRRRRGSRRWRRRRRAKRCTRRCATR